MRYAGAVVAAYIVVEIVAAVAVAHAVSWPLTVLLLVAVSLVGAELLRREGWAAFRGRRGLRTPERQLGDTAAGVLAATLVAVPGFVSAAIGLLALTPPGRAVARRMLAARFARGLVRARAPWMRTTRPVDDPRVVDSTLDTDQQPSPRIVDLRKDDGTL